MLAQATRGGMAVLLCAAIGCQQLHDVSKYDPLVLQKTPGGGSESELAATSAPNPSASSPRLASQDAEPALHYVSYAPTDSGPPAGGPMNGAAMSTPAAAVPNAGDGGLLSTSERSRAPKSKWSDSLIVRGQTPLRQVFASDRAILGAIIIAAIIIPFAVHDSRQANPPLQYQ